MKALDVSGQRFGLLTVLGPGEPYLDSRGCAQGRWLCRCDCGEERSVSASSLTRGKTRSCGCMRFTGSLKPAGALRRQATISYFGVHRRLGRDRGRADGYPCVDCGETAHSWSYDGTDPDELFYDPPGKRRLKYSMDLGRYFPRCRGCHNKHDGITPPPNTRARRRAG